jgi:hypothetical protein
MTLLAILLAFAAPAPIAETAPILEDEAIVEVSRGGRILRRREHPAAPRVVPAAAVGRPIAPAEVAFRAQPPAAGWTPRLFSRPPPA